MMLLFYVRNTNAIWKLAVERSPSVIKFLNCIQKVGVMQLESCRLNHGKYNEIGAFDNIHYSEPEFDHVAINTFAPTGNVATKG